MIRIIITGGTIDKHYDETNGQLVFSDTSIPKLLETGRCTLPIVYQRLMLLDSLEISDSNRQTIRNACASSPEKQIIITHGTDTMVETAQYIGSTINDKTILLTGAMIPYSFGNSDAMFNLGNALSAVQCMPPGTYVSMNGFIHHYDQVIKNKPLGIFQSTDTQANKEYPPKS